MVEGNNETLHALRCGNLYSKNRCLGREKEIETFEKILDEVSFGTSIVKLICGDYGVGKSFFLKAIEDLAYEKNFAVSWVNVSNSIPFNKIDVVYKNIARNLKCKTGTSLEHIVKRWITGLKLGALCQTNDPQEQICIVREAITADLSETREHNNSFATVIEKYYQLMVEGDFETADLSLEWLCGRSDIPFTVKKRFGVKGDISKENALQFLESLSIFVQSIGYSGLVVIINEAEFMMYLQNNKPVALAYNYIFDIFNGFGENYKNSLFVFSATPEWYKDKKRGLASHPVIYSKVLSYVGEDEKNIRSYIFRLKDARKEEFIDISHQIIDMHSKAYNWDANEKFSPVLEELIDFKINQSSLFGCSLSIKRFVQWFICCLDVIEQNPNHFKNDQDILNYFKNE